MSRKRLLIRTINDFRRHYRQLGSGDVIIGVLALRPGEEIKVLDLAERGVTTSAGVAAWEADELPNDLLKRADEALYAAKSCGGDCVVAHD